MLSELKNKHVHFVGIGGAGMGPIAEIMLNQGYKISGSDMNNNAMTEHLKKVGVVIYQGHNAANTQGADIVVFSTIIAADNPELVAAHQAGIPLLRRAQMLAELMRTQFGIAIAGTHGKTTTTSLVTCVLAEGGLDPTYVIGGLLRSAGNNGHIGKSQYFVAEADESDASFLFLDPKISIITNIDLDHMETYNHDAQCLYQAFVDFVHRLPADGKAVVCVDDPTIKQLLPRFERSLITYGFGADADIQALDFRQVGAQTFFNVRRFKQEQLLSIVLNLAGKHNVLNALSAIAVATNLGVDDQAMQKALAQFGGVGRRMQSFGDCKIGNAEVLVLDDYGHHPREIEVTLEAVRNAWPEKRLVLAFQPHRYTRTRDLMQEFATVLATVDMLVLLDIYPASEKPIPGITGQTLLAAAQAHGLKQSIYVAQLEQLPEVLAKVLRNGDVLMMQGAGSIGTMPAKLQLGVGR